MVMLLLFLLLFLNIKDVFAALRINEIYPAPPTGESEWIELYNDADAATDSAKYILTDLVGNKLKFETATISAFGFTIASSSSVLNNTGDTIFLKNILNEIQEIATYSGTFSSEDSYGKCPDFNGLFFKLPLPTKKSSNLVSCLALTPTTTPVMVETEAETEGPNPTKTPTRTPTPSRTPTPPKAPTPTKLLIRVTQKNNPPSRSSIKFKPTQNTSIFSSSQEVLGANSRQPIRKKSNSRFLSFLSAAYSLLTATSVLIKIKFNIS